MSPSLEKIANEAMSLSLDLRAELADLLVESIESAPADESQLAWYKLAQKRLDEVRSGKVQTLSGEEVMAEAERLVNP